MTRREIKLVEALVGESRLWVDELTLGTTFAAGRGSRKQGGGGSKRAGGKGGGSSKKQSATAKSTGKKSGGGTNALTKRASALKGTGRAVAKPLRRVAKAKG